MNRTDISKTGTIIFALAGLFLLVFIDFSEAQNLPPVPDWVRNVSALPNWWSNIDVNINSNLTTSNCWFHIKESESLIINQVKTGTSPVFQRRELIKYISCFCDSNNLSLANQSKLQMTIASLYSELSDHKRSAKEYAKTAAIHENLWGSLQGLAEEAELAGDERYALDIYRFMLNELTNEPGYDVFAQEIATVNINRLKKGDRSCPLVKPDWWINFNGDPKWLNDVPNPMLSIGSFHDAMRFISALETKPDKKKVVKAATWLCAIRPMTIAQNEQALMTLAFAYSAVGDHHRAICTAWRILDQYSFDAPQCKISMNFIIKEFQKLGEWKYSREVEESMPCYTNILKVQK